MINYYDRQGRPITVQQRSALENADPQYYRIAETFGDDWRVSTAEAVAGHAVMVERVRHEADVFRSIVDDPAVRAAAIALRDTRKAYRKVVGGYELDEKDYGRIIAAIEASEEAKP